MCEVDFKQTADFINAFSTLVIAAFTALMYFIVRRQLQATKITDRAWLVHELQTPPFAREQRALYVVSIRNTGHTPAWVTGMGIRGRTLENEEKLPEIPAYDMAEPFTKKGTPLSPGGSVEQMIPVDDPKKVALIEEGKLTLYVFGMVTYHDIFGEAHETRYCYRFKPSIGGMNPALRDFYIAGPEPYNKAS